MYVRTPVVVRLCMCMCNYEHMIENVNFSFTFFLLLSLFQINNKPRRENDWVWVSRNELTTNPTIWCVHQEQCRLDFFFLLASGFGVHKGRREKGLRQWRARARQQAWNVKKEISNERRSDKTFCPWYWFLTLVFWWFSFRCCWNAYVYFLRMRGSGGGLAIFIYMPTYSIQTFVGNCVHTIQLTFPMVVWHPSLRTFRIQMDNLIICPYLLHHFPALLILQFSQTVEDGSLGNLFSHLFIPICEWSFDISHRRSTLIDLKIELQWTRSTAMVMTKMAQTAESKALRWNRACGRPCNHL